VPAEEGQHTNVVSVEASYDDLTDEEEDDATYLGVKKPGKITIKKYAPNSKGHAFRFVFDDEVDFELSDGESKVFDALEAGEYEVVEDKSSFPDRYWALLKVECEGNSVPVEVDLYEAKANITLEAGEHIMCVFHNERVNFEEE
jgi:hypothetical protein